MNWPVILPLIVTVTCLTWQCLGGYLWALWNVHYASSEKLSSRTYSHAYGDRAPPVLPWEVCQWQGALGPFTSGNWMAVPSQDRERQTGKIKCPGRWHRPDAVREWGSSQLGLESNHTEGLRAGIGWEYKSLFPPILIWLSSIGNPRMGWRRVWDASLSVRDVAPHKDGRWGGQIQEGKAVSSALPFPTLSSFHPSLSFPRGPSLCISAQEGWAKVSRYLQVSWRTWGSQGRVRLCELNWCGLFGWKPHRQTYPWLGYTCFFKLIISLAILCFGTSKHYANIK